MPSSSASVMAASTSSPPSVRHTPAYTIGISSPYIDRKSTRLNSSHSQISYAVVCLKKKNGDRMPRQGLLRARLLPYELDAVDDGLDQQRIYSISGRLRNDLVEIEVLLEPPLGLVFL